MSTKINIRSPFFVFIGDSDLIVAAQTPSVAFDATKAALYNQSVSLAGVITNAISNLTTVTRVTGNFGTTVSSATPRTVDYTVLIPAGYSNTGDGAQTISVSVVSDQPATLTVIAAAATTYDCSHFTSDITTQFAVSDQGVITGPLATGIPFISVSDDEFEPNKTGTKAKKTISVHFKVPGGYANTGDTRTCDVSTEQLPVVDPNTYYLMRPCHTDANQTMTTIIGYSTTSNFTSGDSWSFNGSCYNIDKETTEKDTSNSLGNSVQFADCLACQNQTGVNSVIVQANNFFRLKLCSNGSTGYQTASISNQTYKVSDRVVDSSGNHYTVISSSVQTYSLTQVTVSIVTGRNCPATTITNYYILFACGTSYGTSTHTVGYDQGTFGSGDIVQDSNGNKYTVIQASTTENAGTKISIYISSANNC